MNQVPKVLWQGPYNGGLLVIYIKRPHLGTLYWKVYDPGLLNPIYGSVELELHCDVPLARIIDTTLELVDTSILSIHQRIKDECICAGARLN